MNPVDAIQHVFSNYANFDGRARRSEFWYFFLFQWVAAAVLVWLPYYIFPLFSLATLIPGLAVAGRRLHDTGRSGVYLLLALVPLVGEILLIIWFCEDSQPRSNQYGENPKAGATQARQVRQPVSMPTYGVRCLAGPMQGQTFPIGASGLSFGRETDCNIRFPNGTPGVSNRHCRIHPQNEGLMLTDLGSSYGTFFYNGTQLPRNYPHRVSSGNKFYLGTSQNLFEIVTL